jgi:hypothetical protein
MAAYYYVKTGGTATGDAGRATSQRTGSFATMGASAYYDTEAEAYAATTAPVAGDFLMFSDAYNDSTNSAKTFSNTIGDQTPINIISVSDANADQYSSGATADSGTNFDILLNGHGSYTGFTFLVGDDLLFGTDSLSKLTECSITMNA